MKMSDVFDFPVEMNNLSCGEIDELKGEDGFDEIYVAQDKSYWALTDKHHCEAISHAINCHDDLVQALGNLINVAAACDGWECFPSNALEDAEKSLAKAKGEDNG